MEFEGEKLEDLGKRVFDTLKEACEANPNKEIIVISHQICLRTIICYLLGCPFDNYWLVGQEPGCINILEYKDGKFYVRATNYTPSIFDVIEKETKAW